MTFARIGHRGLQKHLTHNARSSSWVDRVGVGLLQFAYLMVFSITASVVLLIAAPGFAAERATLPVSGARLAAATAANPKQAPRSKSAVDARTIERQIDEMVAELLASEKVQTRGIEPSGPTVFDGVAWETGEGVNAGTSPFGVQMDQAILASLAKRDLTLETRDVTKPKGRFKRFMSGSFRVLGSGVMLTLALGDASGLPIAKVTKLVQYSMALAGKEEALPPNHDSFLPLVRLLRETIVAGDKGPFSLAIGTARGANAAYYVGDTLQVQVLASESCYVRVFHVTWSKDADVSLNALKKIKPLGKQDAKPAALSAKAKPVDDSGTFTRIFPNVGQPDFKLAGGTTYSFPRAGTNVSFVIEAPLGIDAIFAVASTELSELEPEKFELQLGTRDIPSGETQDVSQVGSFVTAQNVNAQAAREILTRGLRVTPFGKSPKQSSIEAPKSPDSADALMTANKPEASPSDGKPSVTPGTATNAPPSGGTPAIAPDNSLNASPASGQSPVSPGTTGVSPERGGEASGKPALVRAICYFTTLAK